METPLNILSGDELKAKRHELLVALQAKALTKLAADLTREASELTAAALKPSRKPTKPHSKSKPTKHEPPKPVACKTSSGTSSGKTPSPHRHGGLPGKLLRQKKPDNL